MALSSGLGRNLGYIGAHASLLVGAAGMLFLQRYLWFVKIAEHGYGPYQTVSYLEGAIAVMLVTDLFVLRWALKSSRTDRWISLIWPALFFGIAVFELASNNI